MALKPRVVCCIVEGHGDVKALPVLLRQVAALLGVSVIIPPPHRLPRGKMMKADDLTRAARLQGARAEGGGLLVVVLDADDDKADLLQSRLQVWLGQATPTRHVIGVAVKEYEAWFLASIESVRRHRSVRADASFTGDPKLPRGAKGRLEALMLEPYSEVIHQPAFSALLDIEAACTRSPSLAQFMADLRVALMGDPEAR